MNRHFSPEGLTSKQSLARRKEEVRLRLALNRQLVLYHSQPLHNPFSFFGQLLFGFARQRGKKAAAGLGTPLWVDVGSLLLGLFAKRLGRLGKLARLALNTYPILNKLRRLG